MSWLARSLATSLVADNQNPRIEEEDDDRSSTNADHESQEDEVFDPNRGVKEDLSELSQTLSRQFWGVASFLAPPPSSTSSYPGPTASDEAMSPTSSPRFAAAVRSDFVEIGGRFRSSISRLSSNLIQFRGSVENQEEEEEEEDEDEDGEEEEEQSVIGVTEEVMAFARNIAMHPETWLDFPLFNEFEETNDFEMSDAQQEHAMAVESLLPRLAALRIELCPAHMSEGCFWKIYFVLLHSRLNKDDAKLLSTPQIDEARAMLLQKLQNKTKTDSEPFPRGLPHRNLDITSASPRGQVSSLPSSNLNVPEDTTSAPSTYVETEKHAVHAEVEIINKSVIEKDPSAQPKNQDLVNNFSEISIHDYDDEYGDDWLEDDEAGFSSRMTIPFENAEDVSFSDLEDEPLEPSSSKSLSNSSKR